MQKHVGDQLPDETLVDYQLRDQAEIDHHAIAGYHLQDKDHPIGQHNSLDCRGQTKAGSEAVISVAHSMDLY